MQDQYNIGLSINGLEKPPADAATDDLSLSSEEPSAEQNADQTSNGTKNKQYEADHDERAKKRQKRYPIYFCVGFKPVTSPSSSMYMNRLLQNRQSAANSRAKKKEYMSRLEAQIKALEDELRKAHQRIEELEHFNHKKGAEMATVANSQETEILENVDVSTEDRKSDESQHTDS